MPAGSDRPRQIQMASDAAKGAIPVVIAGQLVFANAAPAERLFAEGAVGLCALLGHCFPVWLKLRGGKGVATGLGVLLAHRPEIAAVGLVVFAVSFVSTYVSYEWLHFSYHLPHEHPVARNPIIRRLARHHAVHHDPRIMQRWNMNVTVPLMDHMMGTAVDSVDDANRRRARA